MNIFLTEDDLSEMPPELRTNLLNWQMTRISTIGQRQTPHQHLSQPEETAIQLSLLTELDKAVPQPETNHPHITLTQLYDAGITKPGMPIRVRLKKNIAKNKSFCYINSLEISNRGTIFFEGKEFDKPSPLANKINGSSANGWDYVEVKVNGQWVRLEELRQILK